MQCRIPFLFCIFAGVIPVFSDDETCLFVKEQKKIEFYDMKRALQVMGRMQYSPVDNITGEEGAQSLLRELFLNPEEPLLNSTTIHSLPHLHHNTLGSTCKEKLGPKSVAEPSSNQWTSLHDNRTTSHSTLCTPQDFVTIFLLENKRLLSISLCQQKQEEQVLDSGGQ